MKKYSYTLIIVASILNCFSQTPFWTETFGTGCNKGQLANGFNPTSNGSWSVTTIGSPGPFGDNDWFISATEAGMGVGNCSDGCLATGGINRTLHISYNFPMLSQVDIGAYYACYSSVIKRAESPVINCTGQGNVILSFNYLMIGVSGSDYAQMVYSTNGGASWNIIGIPPQTTFCATNKSSWSTYSVVLPNSVDNNPNVKIGFEWQCASSSNSVVSVALDDIALTSSSLFVPNFSISSPICSNTTNTLTASTGTFAVSGYTWYVNPAGPFIASPNSSVSTISFTTPSTYTIGLTATSGTQTSSYTQIAVVNPTASMIGMCNPPNYAVCPGKSATLTVSGLFTTYTWSPISSSSSSVVVSPTVNTIYSVAATSTNGCISNYSMAIYAASDPTVTIGGPTASCSGNTVCLTTTISPAGPTAYNWNGPCGFTSNQSSPCFTPLTACGCTLNLTVQNSYACYGYTNYCINVSSCTGIEERSTDGNLVSFYPNPVSEKLNLVSNSDEMNIEMELLDISGRILINSKLKLNLREARTIDISTISPGIYFARIISENKISQQVKIIKE